jgi:hypothetical protein
MTYCYLMTLYTLKSLFIVKGYLKTVIIQDYKGADCCLNVGLLSCYSPEECTYTLEYIYYIKYIMFSIYTQNVIILSIYIHVIYLHMHMYMGLDLEVI